MDNVFIAEIILMAVIFVFYITSIFYKKAEINKLQKEIDYAKEEGKNYEYILLKLLSKETKKDEI